MIFRTLVLQALKAKRTLWIIYSSIGFGFILLYLSVYPSIQSQSANYDKIFATLPKGLILALNISNNAPTLMGYLSSKHFGLIWLLLITLVAITYGGFSIAREIETKTMGFILSQPIKRWELYLARLFTGVINLVLFIAFSEVVVWPLALLFNYSIDVKGVLLLGVAGLLFGIGVLCLSFMFSAHSNSSARVTTYTGGVLLGMYGIFIASSLVSNLSYIKYLSLFHYITPGDIVANDSIALSSILIFSFFSIITTLLGLYIFQRRQIQI
jgi:ABC-2 type transport system permease protein